MTAEKNYFICRNEECKTETNYSNESITGGKVVEFSAPKKGQTFRCPHCENKYREENGNILLIWKEEKVIESKKDYESFKNQYETNRIHFKKLVLKNINEPDYKGKILSFNKCLIDELVIENVNIKSAYYPIIFSECRIGKVRISKSKILKAKLNTYKSLWSYFGITFNRTSITDSFLVDNCETSIVVSDCEINCPLDFSKNSVIDLALIHNESDPEIKTEKGSVVKRLFEVAGKASSSPEKKIKTTGKTVRDKVIEELHVDPAIKNTSVLENCTIHKLVFEDGDTIKGRLFFQNCTIDNIPIQPHCFEKDLVFLGCTFRDDFIMKRLNFKKSLVFEACTFEANTLFNELKIEEDLYLNYSVFREKLTVSGVKSDGYIKCEINSVQNELNFDDNVITKDLNLSYINAQNNTTLFHNELGGYLFLTQLHLNGILDINMLNAEALTMDDIAVQGMTETDNDKAVVELNKLVLKDNLNITRMEAGGDATFTFTRAGGSVFLIRSIFARDFTAISLESGMNLFMNTDFRGDAMFNSCTFNQQTFTQRNNFRGAFNWGTMHVHNVSFNDNVFDSFYLGTTEASDIKINDNTIVQALEINTSIVGDITFSDNSSDQGFKFNYLTAVDVDLAKNCTKQGFDIDNLKANNLWCKNNRTEHSISLDKSELNDVTMENNLTSRDLLINNSRAHDVYVNSNIVKKSIFINYTKAFDITFKNNHTKLGIEIYDTHANNLNFNNNKIEKGYSLEISELHDSEFYHDLVNEHLTIDGSFKGFKLDKSVLNEANLKDNLINKDFIFNNSATRDMYLVRNQIADKCNLSDMTLNDFIYTGNSVSEVNFLRSLFAGIDFSNSAVILGSINNIAVNKDIRVTDNLFLENILMNKCISGGDLHFYDNKTEKSFELKNSELKDLKIFDNTFGENLNIDNSNTNDFYIQRNLINNELTLNYATSNDLIFIDNNTLAVLFLNSSFSSIAISKCKEVDHVTFHHVTSANNIKFQENIFKKNVELELCVVRKNIELDSNEMWHFDIKNTVANDILLENNRVNNTLFISDAKADDITLKNNQVATGEFEKDDAEAPENRDRGVFLKQCTIDGELLMENNNTSEVLQINETLADELVFSSNKARSLQISRGRYRQAGIYHCREVDSFNCNNLTVSKDFSFVNNAFQGQFDMAYCKIENDLDFNGTVFNGFHRMRKNTVLGSLAYQSYVTTDGTVKTAFNVAIFTTNKFNFVSLENMQINSQFLFDNNTVQGQLKIGMQTLTSADSMIGFPEPVSISGNKMKDALFFNLKFESPLCLRNNNIDNDLTFHNTTHGNTLDLTGCFVGGSFVLHNTKAGSDANGDLILDNTFLDKRISFNNYSPASFSFINATFNGFEIPGEWVMKNKKLLKKNTRDETRFVLKEDILRKKKFEHTDLPYNLIKSHYESNDNVIDLIDEWKELQKYVFSDNTKIKLLEDLARGNEILNAKPYIEQCIERMFVPVYYGFFSDKIIDALEDLSAYFANAELKSGENETKEIAELLKTFFHKYLIALKWFKNKNVIQEYETGKKNRRIYRQLINTSQEEQYHVLRHIYGSNGELKEEDSAYYMWMHYKNISDMKSAPLASKPKYWTKKILYEKIFGWGVDLERILLSTGGLVLLFAAIYWGMFYFTPGLTIKWDDVTVQGSDIGPLRSFVFALQTTFSAVLGDWAPIGAGAIKIPMTINAVLGILFVTFLIGAYGRKMLR